MTEMPRHAAEDLHRMLGQWLEHKPKDEPICEHCGVVGGGHTQDCITGGRP